jgi:S1-C subfamily serine protease
MKIWGIFSLILVSLFLVACSGTGTRSIATIAPTIEQSRQGKVFVLRKGGFVGAGALISVSLNYLGIGKLGLGEILTGSAKLGQNILQVEHTSPRLRSVVASVKTPFQVKNKENSYFVVKFECGSDQCLWVRPKFAISKHSKCNWIQQTGDESRYEDCQETDRTKNPTLTVAAKQLPEQQVKKISKPTVTAEKKSEPKVAEKKKQPPPSSGIGTGTSGSGFFVSKQGHILTNEHVVRKCNRVTVGDNANRQVQVAVLETDRRNDLALLKLSSTSMTSAETKSLISKLGIRIISKSGDSSVPLSSNGLLRSDDVELGEDVLVSGFPYGEIFSNTIKVTKGIVSAIRGMGDDSGQFQMDAAVQAGNSGGPIYDENGNIVGVVISQLNKLKVAKVLGSLPENVNFGIKASTVRQFLTSAGLPTRWSERSKSMSTKELAKIARNQTVMVVCHR